MGKMTQRDAFWNRIYELAANNKELVVVTADMGAPSLDKFRKNLPAQFINVGIAEQNAILIASGLAMEGKRPFVYAIAPFITLRCLEQVRVNNAIMDIPITIVGVGAGFGYEDSGPTHHIIEDIAIMKAMPNIVVNSISDNIMAASVAEMSCSMPHTNYVRLDRLPQDDIYSKGQKFDDGMAQLAEGSDLVILATGSMVHTALSVSKELSKKKINAGVIDIYSIPADPHLLSSKISKAKKIVTLEEHFLAGGFGSMICEIICDCGMKAPVMRIGIPMKKKYCYKYGGRKEIRKFYGIDEKTVLKKIDEFVQQ